MKATCQKPVVMMRRKAGFTLIEMLIVIIILGILAMVIIPQVTVSTDDAKVSTAKQNLATLRSAIGLYYQQHNNTYPILTSTNSNQLTLYSNSNGATAGASDSTYNLGPYVKEGMPTNPFNGYSNVTNDGSATLLTARAANTAFGWVYYNAVGLIFPADSGSSGGTAHINY